MTIPHKLYRLLKSSLIIFFGYFGIPNSVTHDYNSRFPSKFWQSLWKLLGSRVIAILAHNPQVDGQYEYMNNIIGQFFYTHLLN